MSSSETWLEKRNRRKAREAADAERLGDAVEGVAMKRLSGELTKTFTSNGVGKVDPLPSAQAERDRVDAIIARDRRDRIDEQDRQLAELEVREGVYVNLADTVVPPTPEWHNHGEARRFTPKQPKGTVRTISTVRRVVTPIVARLQTAGRIDDRQFSACMWYRALYERAGLEGRVAIARYAPITPSGSGGDPSYGHLACSIEQAYARQNLRDAHAAVRARYLKFFEKIVIHDLPIRRASTYAQCPQRKADSRFRDAADRVADFCEKIGIDLTPALD